MIRKKSGRVNCLLKLYGANQEKGSILVIAVFVIFFLSVIALSVSQATHTQATLLRRYIDKRQSFYLARGAMFQAWEELKADKKENGADSFNDAWRTVFQDQDKVRALDLIDREGINAGTYSVVIIDESSKINLNTASSDILEQIIAKVSGKENPKLVQTIISYRNMAPEHSGFKSVYELLLLDGIEKDVFWGEDTNDNVILDDGLLADNANGSLGLGLKDLLTVYSGGKININTAGLDVLASMPAMTEETANLLIETRKDNPFNDLERIKELAFINEAVYRNILKWATVKSDIYSVFVSAQASGTRVKQQINAVVDRSQEELKVVLWRED